MHHCQYMHLNLNVLHKRESLAMLISCPQQCGDIGRVLGQRWRAIVDCTLPSRRQDVTRNAQGDSVEFYRNNGFSIHIMHDQHDPCFMNLAWEREQPTKHYLWQRTDVHGAHRALIPEPVPLAVAQSIQSHWFQGLQAPPMHHGQSLWLCRLCIPVDNKHTVWILQSVVVHPQRKNIIYTYIYTHICDVFYSWSQASRRNRSTILDFPTAESPHRMIFRS